MDTQEIVKEDIKSELQEELPSRYKVVLLNDDYTSMEFVVEILMNFFNHTTEEAVAIMLLVHEKGRGVCGVFTFEIAETKVLQVKQEATKRGFPLRAIIEEE